MTLLGVRPKSGPHGVSEAGSIRSVMMQSVTPFSIHLGHNLFTLNIFIQNGSNQELKLRCSYKCKLFPNTVEVIHRPT